MDSARATATFGGNCDISPHPEILWLVSMRMRVLTPTGKVVIAVILMALARSSTLRPALSARAMASVSRPAAAATTAEDATSWRRVNEEGIAMMGLHGGNR